MTRFAMMAALLLATSAAAAQTVTPAPKAPPAGAVTNPKGNVTRAQMRAQVRAIFDKADVNHDEYISKPEFAARMTVVLNRAPPGTPGAPTKEQAQQVLDAAYAAFAAVDTDGDGKLNRTEASRRALAAFDAMDKNKDGVLTLAEKTAARGAPVVPKAKVAAPTRR